MSKKNKKKGTSMRRRIPMKDWALILGVTVLTLTVVALLLNGAFWLVTDMFTGIVHIIKHT